MQQRRRSYTTATGTPKPPAGQPEVLRLLDKSIGNKWFLHLLLPAVVGLNGWAHMYAVLPTDTYWLPAAYWTYSVVSVPLLFKTKPAKVWQVSSAMHVMNGFLYAQVMGQIWRMRSAAEEAALRNEGEELEARFIKRD